MPLNTISFGRSPTSYARIRSGIGALIRNRRFQLRRPRVRELVYLDIGCGPNAHAECINLDYLWHPRVDVCWDITRGLPFPDATMRGVFSEHCLEHFPRTAAIALLHEIRRVLALGGVLRVVVPDAGLYLDTYARLSAGDPSAAFPYQTEETRDPLWTPLASVNRVYYQDRESPFGHRMMYDFALLRRLLEHTGFIDISRRSFGQGSDPRLLNDSPSRACESLYVEARCPPIAAA
jgi:predicted SAM-dependent methyltransferase